MKSTANGIAASSTESPRLFSRQRHLLALLHELGGQVTNTDFQKLLFLHCQEDFGKENPDGGDPPYEFVPYKYGAFSHTSYADRRRLTGLGLLLAQDSVWGLTESGRRVASSMESQRIKAFATRHRGQRGDALVAETYRQYPYYAIRSERAESLLRNDQRSLRAIDAIRPYSRRGVLFTIGYQGKSLEHYLNVLIRAGVSLLCDIRRNPISRKYGFSKNTLDRCCESLGIAYNHLPELGIASSRRRSLSSESDYKKLFDYYRQYTLPRQKTNLRKVVTWLQDGEAVAFTCYEQDVRMCHRGHTAEAVLDLRRFTTSLWSSQRLSTAHDDSVDVPTHLP